MRLQSFTAANTSAALLLIKETLGEDAVIIATEDLSDGRVKITAAVEEPDFFFTEEEKPEPLPDKQKFDDTALRASLEYHGVLPVIRDKILAHTRQIALEQGKTKEQEALSACFKDIFHFYDILNISKPFKMFMGISGSGKSTGIAKVAALCKFRKKSCCIISTDNVRAGAGSQLKAFADILQTPFIYMADARGLYAAAKEQRDKYEMILIDTPGINPFIRSDVDKLRTCAEVVDAEMIMTMDAGKNACDAVEIADIFAGIGAGCLMPTRMDITRRLGGVLSVAGLTGLKLGAAGVSASIAEGIGEINAASLAGLVLNLPQK